MGAVRKFWLLRSLQCGRDVENRGEAKVAMEREVVAWPGQQIRSQKITSKVGIGLNLL